MSEAEQSGESVADRLPKRIDVTEEQLAQFGARNAFSKVAHELYMEAAGVVLVCASARFPDQQYLRRNHAILVGLLVRIFKFMRSIAILTAGSAESREAVYALNRCIAETLINLFSLMRKDDEARFDDFVSKSLGPEKEMLEEINATVAEHGEAIPIEKRMLESINRTFQHSGVDPATVPIKHQEWAENIRKRLDALNWPKAYAFIYRNNSHAIHGTWVDLLMNNLEFIAPDQFDYDPDCGIVDSRLMSPIARLALDASSTCCVRRVASPLATSTPRSRWRSTRKPCRGTSPKHSTPYASSVGARGTERIERHRLRIVGHRGARGMHAGTTSRDEVVASPCRSG